jgi:hypothetical protein
MCRRHPFECSVIETLFGDRVVTTDERTNTADFYAGLRCGPPGGKLRFGFARPWFNRDAITTAANAERARRDTGDKFVIGRHLHEAVR